MTDDKKYVIGFAGLEEISDYAIAVRESLEAACAKHDNIELVIRDNDLDDDRALENVKYFAEQKVDVAIIYHINEAIGSQIKSILMPTPIISVDIPIVLTNFVGINNQEMGTKLGNSLRQWINTSWVKPNIIVGLLDSRVRFAQPRVLAALDILKEEYGNDLSTLFLDMRYDKATNIQLIEGIVKDEIEKNNNIIIFAYNDSSAKYALEVLENYDYPNGVVVSQGIPISMFDLIRNPDVPLIMGTFSNPSMYGQLLLDTALQIIRREKTKANNYVPIEVITPKETA